MKRTKKLLAFLLAFALVFGSLPSGTVTVAAETGSETAQAEENAPSTEDASISEEASADEESNVEVPAEEEAPEADADEASANEESVDEASAETDADASGTEAVSAADADLSAVMEESADGVTEEATVDGQAVAEISDVVADEGNDVQPAGSDADADSAEEEAEEAEESEEPLVFETTTQAGVTVLVSGSAEALAGVDSVSVVELSDERIAAYEEAFAEDDSITVSKVIAAYDITLLDAGGNAVEPEGAVSVTITSDVLQEYLEEEKDIQLIHDTNTTVEAVENNSIDSETVSADALEIIDVESNASGEIDFTAESFSTYILATGETVDVEYTGTEGGITWGLTGSGTLYISKATTAEEGYDVGVMKDYSSGTSMAWKDYKDNITTVIIESGVTNIGQRAFMGCSNLTSITIPDSVTSYGTNCFHSCTSLTELNIGKNVTFVGQIGIYLDTSMVTLTVDAENTSYAAIDNWLYELSDDGTCVLWQVPAGTVSTSTSVTVRETIQWNGETYTVTGIGKADSDSYTLAGASAMTSVSFGSAVTEIGANAFNSTGLTSFDGSNVTSYGVAAFISCTSLVNVTLNEDLTAIPNSLFEGCIQLSLDSLPSSLTSIGRMAFKGTALTALVIPDTVTSIGDYAFQNCTSLISVTGGASLQTLKTEGTGDQTNKGAVFYGCTSLSTVALTGTTGLEIPANTFGDSVSTAAPITSFTLENGSFASGFKFYITDKLTTLELGAGVTDVLASICQNQTALTSVTLTGAETIGDYAFSGCSNLETLTPGDSLMTVGDYAFQNTALKCVELPSTVTKIGKFAFDNCSSLKIFSVDSTTLELGSAVLNADTALEVVDLSTVTKLTLSTEHQLAINRQGATVAICYVSTSSIQSQLSNQFTDGTVYFAVTNGGIFDTTPTSNTSLESPIKSGYVFNNWYTKDEAEGWGDVVSTLTAGSIYYARYTESDYSVEDTLDLGSLTYGSTTSQPISATKDNITAENVITGAKFVSGDTAAFTVTGVSGAVTSVTVTSADKLSAGNDYEATLRITTDDGATHDVTVTLQVIKASQNIYYEETAVSKIVSDTAFTNSLTQEVVDGTITYTSDNESVVTVDSTGLVTLTGTAGVAVITATVAETANYTSVSASYVIGVSTEIATATLTSNTDGVMLVTVEISDKEAAKLDELTEAGGNFASYFSGMSKAYVEVQLISTVDTAGGVSMGDAIHDTEVSFTLDYPTETGITADNYSNYEIVVLHQAILNGLPGDYTYGDASMLDVTPTANGIVISGTTLSPFAIGYKLVATTNNNSSSNSAGTESNTGSTSGTGSSSGSGSSSSNSSTVSSPEDYDTDDTTVESSEESVEAATVAEPSAASGAQTGDTANLNLFLVLAAVCEAALIVMIALEERKRRKRI